MGRGPGGRAEEARREGQGGLEGWPRGLWRECREGAMEGGPRGLWRELMGPGGRVEGATGVI